MTRALYYPHTQLTNPELLKTSLLLWDKVETIYPSRESVDLQPLPRLLEEAQELVVESRVPSEAEKGVAQSALVRLLDEGVLHRLDREEQKVVQRGAYGSRHPQDDGQYRIFNSKFLRMTWERLEYEGLAQLGRGFGHYEVSANLGFLMMSLLADACAGTQLEKITDRADAYSWLGELRAIELNSQRVVSLPPDQVAPAYERLVTVSFAALGTRDVPLKNMIELRKREAKAGGADYAKLRRRYHKALNEHLGRDRQRG